MRNRTYGGVRGRKTKVGRKLLRFPPTRLSYRRFARWIMKDRIKTTFPDNDVFILVGIILANSPLSKRLVSDT